MSGLWLSWGKSVMTLFRPALPIQCIHTWSRNVCCSTWVWVRFALTCCCANECHLAAHTSVFACYRRSCDLKVKEFPLSYRVQSTRKGGVYSGTPNDRRPRFVFLAASCTNATPCNAIGNIHVLEQLSAAIFIVKGKVRVDSHPPKRREYFYRATQRHNQNYALRHDTRFAYLLCFVVRNTGTNTQSQWEVISGGHCEDHMLPGCDAAQFAVCEERPATSVNLLGTSRNVGESVTACLYVCSHVGV